MKQKILTALIILLFIHIALSAELTEAPFVNTKNQQDITSTYKSTSSGNTDIYAVEKTQLNVEIKPGSSLNVKNIRGNIRIIHWITIMLIYQQQKRADSVKTHFNILI